MIKPLALLLLACSATFAQQPCSATEPFAVFTIHHVDGDPALDGNPQSESWRDAAAVHMSKDCSREIDYAELKTEIRGFWTDTSLYLLFQCPYKELNLWLPADHSKPRNKLWDRDVVEMFLGDDWENIRHYREFEIAPTGDWIDLAIDLDKKNYDARNWRSGWETGARVDETKKIWYAVAKIPLSAISGKEVAAGTRWRMNLYRIDGQGPDSQRRFLCWQPTCVTNRDPNHVPEHFGTLVFSQ